MQGHTGDVSVFPVVLLLFLAAGLGAAMVAGVRLGRPRYLLGVASAGVVFQFFHFAEHLAQLGSWILHPDSPPAMSGAATAFSRSTAKYVLGNAANVPGGMEVVHLLGNGIFLIGVVALFFYVRAVGAATRTATVAVVIEGIHAVEHVYLASTFLRFGEAVGISTAVGQMDPGPTLWTYRIWWHFIANGLALAVTLWALAPFLRGAWGQAPGALELPAPSLVRFSRRSGVVLAAFTVACCIDVPFVTAGVTAIGASFLLEDTVLRVALASTLIAVVAMHAFTRGARFLLRTGAIAAAGLVVYGGVFLAGADASHADHASPTPTTLPAVAPGHHTEHAPAVGHDAEHTPAAGHDAMQHEAAPHGEDATTLPVAAVEAGDSSSGAASLGPLRLLLVWAGLLAIALAELQLTVSSLESSRRLAQN